MPQIKIRGVSVEKVCQISTALMDDLQKIIACPKEDLTLECFSSTFIMDGKTVQGYPFIEVAWFDRGQVIQDQVAKSITSFIHSLGYSGVDVSFTLFEKNGYYENGEHF